MRRVYGGRGHPTGADRPLPLDPAWAVISDQSVNRVSVAGLVSGTTYHVRLQAIRATALGAFVVAETDVLTYVAP